MRRRLVFILTWMAATAVAVAGSWVGLQPVLAATSPELPNRLSTSQLREAAPVTQGAGSPSAAASTPSPTPAAPSPSPPPPPPAPSPLPPPPPDPPVSSEWERVPEADRRTYERTFVLRGGEVVVRVNRREVEVVSHTENPGYEVSQTTWSRSSVIFTFESVEHTSRLWIMWRNGPYAEVTETV